MQQPPNTHLAQLNIGRIRYEIDDPRMADFTNNLALVNGLAERPPGFVWRFIDDAGNSTSTRPYSNSRIAINLSPRGCRRHGYRRRIEAHRKSFDVVVHALIRINHFGRIVVGLHIGDIAAVLER